MVNMAEVKSRVKEARDPRVCVCECVHVSVSVRAYAFAYMCVPRYVCDALEKLQGEWPGRWLRWEVSIPMYTLNSADVS